MRTLSDEDLKRILGEEGMTRAMMPVALRAMRRAISESLSATPKTEDGWIEWKGGECPVFGDDRVEVRFRVPGSHTADTGEAHDFSWLHDPPDDPEHESDIIAYRLVSPPSDPSRETDARLAALESEIVRLKTAMEESLRGEIPSQGKGVRG